MLNYETNQNEVCWCGGLAEFTFNLRGFDFFDCKKCTLRFVSPRYLATEIYDNDYFLGASHGFGFTNYEEDKIASQDYLLKFLGWIKQYSDAQRIKLLDVGAANGYFVQLATESGFDVTGIEISKSAVDWAIKLNRPVIQGTLETLENGIFYDAITALDVLEHIPEPLDFLIKARKIISGGGVLLLNVPNYGSTFSKISAKKWHAYLPPEHWIYFNKKSMRKMLTLAGFEVMDMRVISKTFTIGYICLTVANSPQIPHAIRKILLLINKKVPLSSIKLKLYLPLFDNLTVIAKPVAS